MLTVSCILAAAPAKAAFVFCQAQSDSSRGRGLILSSIFEPRLATNLPWLRQAFTGFLGSTYAPYGNNWVFREQSARCDSFAERQDAIKSRDTLILQEQRGGQAVYYVTFVGP